MPAFFNAEWLNSNTLRSYPLAEHASKKDITNTIVIPDSFIVEMNFSVPIADVVLSGNVFLYKLSILGNAYLIEFACRYNDETHSIATVSIPVTGFTDYTRYDVINNSDSILPETYGAVVIGSLKDISALPGGVYEFSPDGGALDPDCIRPIIQGVSSITIEQGGQRSNKLRRSIVLRAGNNIRLSTILNPSGGYTIQIDAIPDGTSFGSSNCECTQAEAPCIRTINNIAPDSQQNFTILGDDCLTVSPIANGVQLNDKCSKPCCGCVELTEVIRALKSLENTATTLDSFMQRLYSAQTTLHTTVMPYLRTLP